MDVWRKVEQLDDAEQLESQAYIRNKYGLYKSIDKRDPERQKFIYFYCTKSKSKTCRFKLRWDRRFLYMLKKFSENLIFVIDYDYFVKIKLKIKKNQ